MFPNTPQGTIIATLSEADLCELNVDLGRTKDSELISGDIANLVWKDEWAGKLTRAFLILCLQSQGYRAWTDDSLIGPESGRKQGLSTIEYPNFNECLNFAARFHDEDRVPDLPEFQKPTSDGDAETSSAHTGLLFPSVELMEEAKKKMADSIAHSLAAFAVQDRGALAQPSVSDWTPIQFPALFHPRRVVTQPKTASTEYGNFSLLFSRAYIEWAVFQNGVLHQNLENKLDAMRLYSRQFQEEDNTSGNKGKEKDTSMDNVDATEDTTADQNTTNEESGNATTMEVDSVNPATGENISPEQIRERMIARQEIMRRTVRLWKASKQNLFYSHLYQPNHFKCLFALEDGCACGLYKVFNEEYDKLKVNDMDVEEKNKEKSTSAALEDTSDS